MAELPSWQPLNGVAPPALQGGGSGRVVALVATQRAVAEGWAASAALALARSWSDQGRRIVLVDGALQAPSLHEVAGIPNREGLTDAALHGASVGRVTQSVGDGLLMITAGTPVADTQTVVRSPRWFRLSAGFNEAGVTLMLFLRDQDPGAAGFLGSASDIVVLGADGEPAPGAVTDLEPLVRAVTGLEEGATPMPAVVAPAPRRALAAAEKGSGGTSKVLLFVLVVVVIAAALGYLLTSGLI